MAANRRQTGRMALFFVFAVGLFGCATGTTSTSSTSSGSGAGCGNPALVCGDGTEEQDGECVAMCPDGTYYDSDKASCQDICSEGTYYASGQCKSYYSSNG